MDSPAEVFEHPDEPAFLQGGGDMGRRIRGFDWAATPLGAPHTWPAPLRTTVRIMLTTNHPVFVFWGEQHVCLYNDAYGRSLGPEKHPAMLGARGREAWQEIWSTIGPQIEQVMRGEGATWHENQLVPMTRHGRLEPVYWTYSYGPIDDPAAPNGVGGVLVLCTETTAQVIDRQTLRASDARWQHLFNQTPGFMCVLSGPQHRFEFANPRYQQLVGGRDIIGKDVAVALPEVVDQGFVALLDRVYASGIAHTGHSVPLRLRDDAGATRQVYVDFVYQPIYEADGRVGGMFVLGSDVTDRVAVERALSDSEARLRALADALPAGAVFVVDRQLRYVTVAGEALDAAGFTPADLIGKTVAEIAGPGMAARYEADYRRALEGHRFATEHEAHGRYYLTRGGPLRRDDSTVYGALVLSVDITERRRVEERLAEVARQKDEFLAVLGHELRNPLAAIRNAATLLALDGLAKERAAWCTGVIARQVGQMGLLLDDLLDVARVTQGKLRLSMRTVALSSVVDAAVETVLPLITERQHTLSVDVPAAPLFVRADTGRLAQVLANLLNNAAKYTPVGGRVVVEARADGAAVEIAVRDNGVGLDSADLERIFEMFSQLPAAHGEGHGEGGLGVGLALAKGLTALHGGTLRAQSAGPGHGASFIVRLPAVLEGAADSSFTPLHEHKAHRRFERVLIADDNSDAAHSLSLLLRNDGYSTVAVANGREALAAFEDFKPQALVLDIRMPELDGYGVARAIRQHPRNTAAAPLLIALTGAGQAQDKSMCLAAGFDVHMTKPVDPDALLRLLATPR